MKKTFVFLLLFSLFMCFPSAAYAEGSTRLYCEASETQSGEYSVQVMGSDISGLAMMQFELAYDPSLASCTAAEVGAAFAGTAVPTVNANTPGHIYFAWDDLKPLKGDGVLLNLRMNVLSEEAAELVFVVNDDFVFAYEDYTEADVVPDSCTLYGIAAEEETETVTEAESPESTAAPVADTVKDSGETGTNNGITVSSNSLSLNKGDSHTLVTDADEENLTWTSSDESVAVITADGKIKAKGNGTAVITVTDGSGAYGTCVITVEGKGVPTVPIIAVAAAAVIAVGAWLGLKRKKTAAAETE